MKLKKKILALVLLAGLAMGGCFNEKANQKGEEKGTTTSQGIVVKRIGTTSITEQTARFYELGKGYDSNNDTSDKTYGVNEYVVNGNGTYYKEELSTGIPNCAVVTSYEDLVSALSVNQSADGYFKVNGFEANASIVKNAMKRMEFSSNSVYVVAKIQYIKNRYYMGSNVVMSSDAQEKLANGADFRRLYGDGYLSSVKVGATSYYVYQYQAATNTTTAKEELKAALSIKYNQIFGISAQSTTITEDTKISSATKAEFLAFETGGGVPPVITTLDQFIAYSKDFIARAKSFTDAQCEYIDKVYIKYPVSIYNKTYTQIFGDIETLQRLERYDNLWKAHQQAIQYTKDNLMVGDNTGTLLCTNALSTISTQRALIENNPTQSRAPYVNEFDNVYTYFMNVNSFKYYTHATDGHHYVTQLNEDGSLKNWTWSGGHGVGDSGWQLVDLFGTGRKVYYTHGSNGYHYATRVNLDGTVKNWTWSGGHGVGNIGWKFVDLFGTGRKVYYTANNYGTYGTHYATQLNEDGTLKNWTWSGGHGLGDSGYDVTDVFGTGRNVYYTHSSDGKHYATQLNEDGTLKNWTWVGGHGVGNIGWKFVDLFGTGRKVYYTANNYGTYGTHYATQLNEDGTFKNWTWSGGHGLADSGYNVTDLFGKGRNVYYTHSSDGKHYATQLNEDGTLRNWTWVGGHGVADSGWTVTDLFGKGRNVYYTPSSDGKHHATQLNEDGTFKNWTWVGGHGRGDAGWDTSNRLFN